MSELLFGALAFLALLGWAVSVGYMTRQVAEAHFRNAQSLELEERVNSRLDDRISAVVNRWQALKNRKVDGKDENAPLPNADENAEKQERIRQRVNFAEVGANGEASLEFPGGLGEQPLDTVE